MSEEISFISVKPTNPKVVLNSSLIISTTLFKPFAPSAPIPYIRGLPTIVKSAPSAKALTISLPPLIPLSNMIG